MVNDPRTEAESLVNDLVKQAEDNTAAQVGGWITEADKKALQVKKAWIVDLLTKIIGAKK